MVTFVLGRGFTVRSFPNLPFASMAVNDLLHAHVLHDGMSREYYPIHGSVFHR